MGFAEPVIGPARGPHRARAMGLPRFGPDPLAQPILRAARALLASCAFFLTGFLALAALFAGRKPPTAFLTLPRVSCQPFQLMSNTMPLGSLNLRSKPSSSRTPRRQK